MSKQSLRQRLQLVIADAKTLNQYATQYHYLHRAIHNLACPFGWLVSWMGETHTPDGTPYGFIIFSSVHFVRLRGEFGYPGLPTKWQILTLSRLWLDDTLPKLSESCIMGKALRQIQTRWLEVHPPRRLDQPYHILKVISYSDTRFHKGTTYRACNFRFAGETVGQARHTSGPKKNNTRGPGTQGSILLRFVYDLTEPRWQYHHAQGTPLWQNRRPHGRSKHIPTRKENTHV